MLEESAMDSLELHDDELATEVGGSSFKDFLNYKIIKLTSRSLLLSLQYFVLVLIVFKDILQLLNVAYRLQIFLNDWYRRNITVVRSLII